MFSRLFVFCAVAAYGITLVFAQTPSSHSSAKTELLIQNAGYLGVDVVEVTRDNFSKFGLPDVRGVAIEKVIEGSPASAVGLRSRDVIIVVEGEVITGSRMLSKLMIDISPERSIKLIVIREGVEREFTVTVGKRPELKTENSRFQSDFPGIQIPNRPQMQPSLLDLFRNRPKSGRGIIGPRF